jgi:hypothetical protein
MGEKLVYCLLFALATQDGFIIISHDVIDMLVA